jgi:hypothetical protein
MRQYAEDHPRARSVMLRLLRAVRDAVSDLLEDDPPADDQAGELA